MDETSEEKDLGVYVSNSLKPSAQSVKSANRAMSVLRMVKRNFPKIDREDFAVLYKTYIRPHMEYCVQAWSPYMVKDIEVLEKVQRRATKCVVGMKSKTYEERLKLLKLTTLERRRQRGDLIEVYKILTGKEDIDSSCLFQLASQDLNLRGHHLKLYKKPCHLNVRQYYFSQRIVNSWNSLPKSRGDSIREQIQESFGQIFHRYGQPIKLCFLCPSSTSTSKQVQILSESDHLRLSDVITIFKMAAVSHVGFSLS